MRSVQRKIFGLIRVALKGLSDTAQCHLEQTLFMRNVRGGIVLYRNKKASKLVSKNVSHSSFAGAKFSYEVFYRNYLAKIAVTRRIMKNRTKNTLHFLIKVVYLLHYIDRIIERAQVRIDNR